MPLTHPDPAAVLQPHELARQLRLQRDQRDADGVARWKAWLRDNLDATLALSDDELCAYLKWLFPSGGHSAKEKATPTIGRRAVRAAVQAEPLFRYALLESWDRMMEFYGLMQFEGRLVWRGPRRSWARSAGQDDRRISRILYCMHSAGFADKTEMLMDFLETECAGIQARAEALSWWRHQIAA